MKKAELGLSDVRNNVERAFSSLGIGVQVWRRTLDATVSGPGAERDRWVKLDPGKQPFVADSTWKRFPWQRGWEGLHVVGSGRKIDEALPIGGGGAVERMRAQLHKWGVVFDDASILAWRDVLWEDEGELVVVQRSMHYQRWDTKGSDWVCRYDYQPLVVSKERRDPIEQPVHHIHMGARDDVRTHKKHFPSAPLGLFSMLSWVVRAFPETVDARVRETLEAKQKEYRGALEPTLPLICPCPPFPRLDGSRRAHTQDQSVAGNALPRHSAV